MHRFELGGEVVPSLVEAPVKSLGRWYTVELNDVGRVEEVRNKLLRGLKRIDGCGLPGKLKVWCLKFGLMPRVLWPLMMYDIAIGHVERMEVVVSGFVRRWLGVPHCLTNIAFYGQGGKLQFPLTSLTDEFKVVRVQEFMMLRDSSDAVVKNALPEKKGSRKWNARAEVDEMEERLQQEEVMGMVQHGKHGLGWMKHERWGKACVKERRKMVEREVRRKEEEGRYVKAVGQAQQGAWTRWEGVRVRMLKWQEIWRMEPILLNFLLWATYDVLPSPVNLRLWGLLQEERCYLCGGVGTVQHALSACSVALAAGQYRW